MSSEIVQSLVAGVREDASGRAQTLHQNITADPVWETARKLRTVTGTGVQVCGSSSLLCFVLCSDKRREMLQSIRRVGCHPVIFVGQYQLLQVDLHELVVLKK